MLSLRKINWLVLQRGKGAFCCCGGMYMVIQYRYQQINCFYVFSLNYVFNNFKKYISYFYISIRPLPKCNKYISYIIHAFTELNKCAFSS